MMGPDPRSAQISPCCRIYEPLKWIQKQEVPAMSLIERKRKLAIIAITFFAVGSASLGIAYAKNRPPVPPVDVTKTDPSKGGPQPQPIPTPFPTTGCTGRCPSDPPPRSEPTHPEHSGGHH